MTESSLRSLEETVCAGSEFFSKRRRELACSFPSITAFITLILCFANAVLAQHPATGLDHAAFLWL